MNKKYYIAIIIVILLLAAGALAYSMFFSQKPANQETTNTNKQNAMDTKGLQIETLKEGSGNEAKVGDTVSVNYTGMLTNGTTFDSNVDSAFGHVEPFSFTLGQNKVIQGWELGVKGMKVGEKRKLTIPPELAYGSYSIGNLIPANSALIFEVELLKLN